MRCWVDSEFIEWRFANERPVFWGDLLAFDWIAFTGLFGGLPFRYPQLCLDIQALGY